MQALSLRFRCRYSLMAFTGFGRRLQAFPAETMLLPGFVTRVSVGERRYSRTIEGTRRSQQVASAMLHRRGRRTASVAI